MIGSLHLLGLKQNAVPGYKQWPRPGNGNGLEMGKNEIALLLVWMPTTHCWTLTLQALGCEISTRSCFGKWIETKGYMARGYLNSRPGLGHL